MKNRSENKSKKKGKRLDEGSDNQGDGGDGSGSGGEEASPPSTRGPNKSSNFRACPYCLVFPHMLEIARFESCQPLGSLNIPSLWK